MTFLADSAEGMGQGSKETAKRLPSWSQQEMQKVLGASSGVAGDGLAGQASYSVGSTECGTSCVQRFHWDFSPGQDSQISSLAIGLVSAMMNH